MTKSENSTYNLSATVVLTIAFLTRHPFTTWWSVMISARIENVYNRFYGMWKSFFSGHSLEPFIKTRLVCERRSKTNSGIRNQYLHIALDLGMARTLIHTILSNSHYQEFIIILKHIHTHKISIEFSSTHL